MDKIMIGNNVISEKSVAQSSLGKYVIEVLSHAPKSEIKKQIEKLFRVKVVKINSLNYPAKPKTFQRIPGKSKSTRRMIITLAPGQKIREFEFDTKEDKKTKVKKEIKDKK